MRIQKLRLIHFRNLIESEIEFSDQINFFSGSNGQGKTSVLEAIGLLSSLNSFRGGKADDMLSWDGVQSRIQAELKETEDLESTVSLKLGCELKKTETGAVRRTAFVNEKAVASHIQYLKKQRLFSGIGFHTIAFNPSDHELIRGEPKQRRNYLDHAIGSEDLFYFETLKRYKDCIEERNALLKKSDGFSIDAQVRAFDEPLLEDGSKILFQRMRWLHSITPAFQQNLAKIAPRQRPLILQYFYGQKTIEFSGQEPVPSLEQLHGDLRESLGKSREKERRLKTTLVGPHRDDWNLLNGISSLKYTGSQGEIRSALLAIKMAEIQHFYETTQILPVLLLDDFSSELDRERRANLLDFLVNREWQVFVTSTESVPFPAKRFLVEAGSIQEMA